jgi:hypothetical protein
MNNTSPLRLLIISSRVSESFSLTSAGAKHLQHIFTTWFPRAVYADLTDDTVRIDVVVRQGNISKKNVYSATFLADDGTTIKAESYDEDRIVGVRCDQYAQNQTRYNGQKDGLDFRHVYYTTLGTRKTL